MSPLRGCGAEGILQVSPGHGCEMPGEERMKTERLDAGMWDVSGEEILDTEPCHFGKKEFSVKFFAPSKFLAISCSPSRISCNFLQGV